MKQTAVEWLFTQLDLINLLPREKWVEARKEILENAKQMEKGQIVDAFGVGCQVESTRLVGYHGMAEQYYTENYGK